MRLSRREMCMIYLQNVLLAFFYFVLQFLKLFRVEGRVHFAIVFSRYRQLLLFARSVMGFLRCLHLPGGGVPEHRASKAQALAWGAACGVQRRGKSWCQLRVAESQVAVTGGFVQQTLTGACFVPAPPWAPGRGTAPDEGPGCARSSSTAAEATARMAGAEGVSEATGAKEGNQARERRAPCGGRASRAVRRSPPGDMEQEGKEGWVAL